MLIFFLLDPNEAFSRNMSVRVREHKVFVCLPSKMKCKEDEE